MYGARNSKKTTQKTSLCEVCTFERLFMRIFTVLLNTCTIYSTIKNNYSVSDVLPDHIKSFCPTENQERPIYQLLRQWQRS